MSVPAEDLAYLGAVHDLAAKEPALVEDYLERRFEPISMYEEHQEALFVGGVQYCDENIWRIEALGDNADQDDLHWLRTYKRVRSELYEVKIKYEIDRDNVHVATWLLDGVTDLPTQINIFEHAFQSDTDAASSVLMAFGDLRAEIEDHGTPGDLMNYLCAEIRCGLSLHTNIDAVRVLADAFSPYLKNFYLEDNLERSILKYANKLIDSGDYSAAAELYPEVEDRAKGLIATRIRVALLKTQPKTESRGTRMLAKQHHKQIRLANKRYVYDRYSDAEGLVMMYIVDPGLRDALGTLDFTKLHLLSPKSLAGEYLVSVCEAEGFFSEKTEAPQPEQEYANSILNGELEILDYPRVLSLATELALKHPGSEEVMTNFYGQLSAQFETMLVAWSRDQVVVMDDMIDQIRFKTKYNSEIKQLFEQAKVIPLPSQRLRFLSQLAQFQSQLDQSEVSAYQEILEEVAGTAIHCQRNKLARMSIGEDKVYEICQKLGIDLDARQESR